MTKILLAVILLVLLAVAFETGLLRFNYPSSKVYPIHGIDISHHQGIIDWRQAYNHGIRFAYIKATEGEDFVDSRFVTNWIGCRYAGVSRGAYHYFSFDTPGARQAKNFLETVPLEPGVLPPAIDLELGGHGGRAPRQADLERELTAFVTAISGRFSGPPVFYVTMEFYKRYLAGNLRHIPAHRLWIRNVLHEPSDKAMGQWSFWQYANRGHISGIHGSVDLDIFNGSQEEFDVFLQKTSGGRTERPILWQSEKDF